LPHRHRLGALVVAVLVAGACGGDPAPRAEPASTTASSAAAAPAADATTAAPACQPAPLEVRAATVLIVGIGEGSQPDDPLVLEVASLGVGGVTVRPPNIEDEPQLRALIAGIRQASPRPLLVGVDEEGGRVSRLRDIIGGSEPPRTLGQQPADQVTAVAAERAAAVRDLGFDLAFAPVVDADGGPSGGVIGDRSFGADPATAGAQAAAYATGMREVGLVAVAKHFPGQGGLLEDSHDGAVVSDAPLSEVQATAAGFQAAIDAGVPAVMMSHVTFTSLGPLPASVEPAAYALLRSLGFDGVAMTDSLGMGAVVQRWPIPDGAVMAIAAGADAVLANQGDQAVAMRDAIAAAVVAGTLPERRLDEAVSRVLRMRGEDPATMVCP
jgi:beta-N-acetylhexosaminidase